MQTEIALLRHFYTAENGFSGIKRNTRMIDRSGIKEFIGDSPAKPWSELHQASSIKQLRNDSEVWRAEEVYAASQILAETNKLIVYGGPQSGKGTILYGLSEICEQSDHGCMFIDGHRQELTTDEILLAIQDAESRQIPIFFDSGDYLMV